MSVCLERQLQFSNLSYKTIEQTLINYFSLYGLIDKLVLYRDDQDQSLRKGCLIYKDVNSINLVMSKRPHCIDNRELFLQRTMPISSNPSFESLSIHLTVKELFISRLCSRETKEIFIDYFQRFGIIRDCRVFNSHSLNSKQTGYAFLRFDDYDSVDRIILSRPHMINSKFYHLRKCIPREYNYISSFTKPIGRNKHIWRDYAFGLINTRTQAIIYPSLPTCTIQPVRKQENISLRKSSTNELELNTLSSLSSSISIINSSVDDFTPLYSTAIAYSPTTDII